MNLFNHNHWISALVLMTPLAACTGEPTSIVASSNHRAADRITPIQRDCQGSPLPACADGWAGPGCDYPCSPGFDTCSIEHYCHADGRVHGLAASGTRLFELPSADPRPEEVAQHLEAWIAQHAEDLGFADGLTPSVLQIEPLHGTPIEQGRLSLYRFFQYHGASNHRALVVGDGSILTVEVGPQGARMIKGTIIDPREPYAHRTSPASEDLARRSIEAHVRVRTGLGDTEARVTVDDLGLVAVPGPNVMAWRGVVHVNGQVTLATVTVEADPQPQEHLLDLIEYQDHDVSSLGNTMGIQVRTEDLGTDILAMPILETTVSSLHDGAPLLGSIDDLSARAQLATEGVVALDLQGNTLTMIMDPSDVSRYTSVSGHFDAAQPSAAFDAQRHYHVSQEAYALVNNTTAGSWDSAVSLFRETVSDPQNPGGTIDVPLSSDYGLGQFRPRILDANEYAPLGGPAGQATFALVKAPDPVPEIYQSPGPGLQPEVISYIKLPPGSTSAAVLLHELGHAFDVFLGPGFPRTHVPPCMGACDTTCDEDTSDEALPLTETIAQMFALWQFQRLGAIAHDDCDILGVVMTGTGQGSTLVHHPSCMNEVDQISLFLRTDDPTCLDPQYCDKPTLNETDPAQASAHLCDATAGYNVASLLQAWWNMLHGQYCEPFAPFACTDLPPVAWPAGCDAPGSTTPCATLDEVSAVPFLYALRTNPLSYKDFIDAMATFVACNYGEESYTWFNQALCDHHLRGCGEPPPMICQTCGNGIREASEQCDGLDLGLSEHGSAITCEDHGFDGGTLACDPATCTFDLSPCVADSTSTGELDADDPADGSTSERETDTDTDTVGARGGVLDDGCSCRSDGGGGSTPWLLVGMLGLLGRRRRQLTPAPEAKTASKSRSAPGSARGPVKTAPKTALTSAGLAALIATLGCAAPPVAVKAGDGGARGDESSTAADEGEDESIGEHDTDDGPPGWPEDALGVYARDTALSLEIPGMYIGVLQNLQLQRDALLVTRLACDGSAQTTPYAVTFESDGVHVRPEREQSHVVWLGLPVAEELVFRAGDSCAELVTELIGPVQSDAEPWRWLRGTAVITDACGLDDDVWSAELSPDAATKCASSR